MSEKIEKEIILENPSNKKYHFIYKGKDKQIIIRNEDGEDFVAFDETCFEIAMLSLGYRIYDILGIMVRFNLNICPQFEMDKMDGFIKTINKSVK